MAAVAGVIVAVIAAGVAAYAANQQAEAAAAQSRRQSRIAQQQAETAQQAAAADARTRARQLERQQAAARARFGASGVVPEEGTPLLVLMQSEEEAALDVARVRHGGAVAAHGFGLEAVEARLRGQQAKRQGTLATSGALLQGVSGATSSYAKYKAGSSTLNSDAYNQYYGPR